MRTYARTIFVIAAAAVLSLMMLPGGSAKLKREPSASNGSSAHMAR